ncbi:MAG: hypothetical protein NZ585_05275 [Chloracidobacterium sp.]|nr:hypothetical protein [Chloracidobacterium sp.]MDW8216895.1 hypothetical protein [Acidobacteriota bacterium]
MKCASHEADTNVNCAVRDVCRDAILRELGVRRESGVLNLTLEDFDIVITADGAEVESGVFETQGGTDWAKRNLKRIGLIYPDGTMRVME